jgi:hypothetical protein
VLTAGLWRPAASLPAWRRDLHHRQAQTTVLSAVKGKNAPVGLGQATQPQQAVTHIQGARGLLLDLRPLARDRGAALR